MKIFRQLNNNDCGIAVTKTLIHHYYSISPPREELLSQVEIDSQGISLWELESLNKKYGIQLESYELPLKDLKSVNMTNVFILLIKQGLTTHFVIAKKNKHFVTFYDTAVGRVKYKYRDLTDIYLGIFISVKPYKKPSNDFATTINSKKILNYTKTIKSLMVDLLILATSFYASICMKEIFQVHIMQNWFNQMGTVVFVVMFLYVSLFLLEMNATCWSVENKEFYSKKLLSLFFRSLVRKRNSFFSKIGINKFLTMQNHIDNIASHYSIFINKWMVNVVMLVISSAYISFINHYFLYIIFLSLIVQVLYSKLSFHHNKTHYPKFMSLDIEKKKAFFELSEFLDKEIDADKTTHILSCLKEIHLSNFRFNKNFDFYKNILQKMNAFINKVVLLILYLTGAYLCLEDKIKLGDFFLISILYSYSGHAMQEIINYYFSKINYEYSDAIFQEFINIDSHERVKEVKRGKGKINLAIPKQAYLKGVSLFKGGTQIFFNLNINIKNGCFVFGESASGKSSLMNMIAKKCKYQNGAVQWDGREFDDHQITYQTCDSWSDQKLIVRSMSSISPIHKPVIMDLFVQLKIDPNNLNYSKLSSGQKQFMKIIPLLNKRGQLILLDECLSNVHFGVKQKIVNSLYSEITKHNFLIWCEHEKSFLESHSWFPVISMDSLSNSNNLLTSK